MLLTSERYPYLREFVRKGMMNAVILRYLNTREEVSVIHIQYLRCWLYEKKAAIVNAIDMVDWLAYRVLTSVPNNSCTELQSAEN